MFDVLVDAAMVALHHGRWSSSQRNEMGQQASGHSQPAMIVERGRDGEAQRHRESPTAVSFVMS